MNSFAALRCFLLVHCVTLDSYLVHCSSSNVFFKFAESPLEDRGKIVKFVAAFENVCLII
jgi:hypothetical protein